MGDIAEVREGTVDRTTLISGSGEPAAVVNISRQIGGNIIDIADEVEQTLQEQAPLAAAGGAHCEGLRSRDFRARLGPQRARRDHHRQRCLQCSCCSSSSATGGRHSSRRSRLPLTILGTFGILQLAGGTINLMSMGGLAIAIGLVIDDAIVVVENIHRHLGSGATPLVAAQRGTDELVGAVVGSTLTTVVVFIPLALLQGIVGQFFSALSLTLSGAVLLSLVYALLFIPIPAARFLRVASAAHHESGGWLADRYRTLGVALRCGVRGLSSPARSAVAALGTLFFFRLETGFLPEMDEGGYVIDYVTPAGTSLHRNRRDAEARRGHPAKHVPEVAGFTRRTGTELGLFATEQNAATSSSA